MIKKTAVLSRCFFPALFAYFIDNFGLAIVYPIATPFFLKQGSTLLGATLPLLDRTLLLALLISLFPIAQFFGAPLLGSLSDRVGRKKIFIATISGGIVGYLVTGIGIHIQWLPLLLIGRFLTGLFAGNLTLCLAAITDISGKKQERSSNFGIIGTVGGLGFVLAIVTGASLSNPNLASWFRPEIPFFLISFLCAINLMLMIRFFQDPRKKESFDKQAFFQNLKCIWSSTIKKHASLIYLAYFFFMLAWITSLQFLSAYLIDLFGVGRDAISLAFVLIAATWSIANFILNPLLSKRIPPQKIFLAGLTFLAIFLVLTLIPHEPFTLFLIHFCVATLCAALAWTNGLATLSNLGTARSQGTLLGVNQSLVAIAAIAGPLIGGPLAGIDIHRLYLFTASSALLGALILFVRPSEHSPRKKP